MSKTRNKAVAWMINLGMLLGSGAGASELVTLPYEPVEAAKQLEAEAAELLIQVKASNLGYSVKESVTQFGGHTQTLRECFQQAEPSTESCLAEMEATWAAFEAVDRYLPMTAGSHPEIYNLYERTRAATDWLRPGYGEPDPGIGQLKAQGVLDNLNYQFLGAHADELNEECLRFGHERKIPYVGRLSVNGQWFGSGSGSFLKLSEACAIIAQNSTAL